MRLFFQNARVTGVRITAFGAPRDQRTMPAAREKVCKVFEGRQCPGDWRVEWIDDDGGCEVAIFSGPNARERAIRYADRQYGSFEEVSLSPSP
jgi:hypothetical protein